MAAEPQEKASQAKDKAQEIGSDAKQKAEDVTAQAREAAQEARQKAGELGDQAQQKASEAAGQLAQKAQEAGRAQAEQRKHQLAEEVSTFARALRLGADELRQREGRDPKNVERLAEQVETFSSSIDRKNTREILTELEGFARQNQALFLGGAFAIGLMGARFLKSSSTPEHLQEVEDGWSTGDLTNRVNEPEHDAIGRPGAPGYQPPNERTTSVSDDKAAGPRTG